MVFMTIVCIMIFLCILLIYDGFFIYIVYFRIIFSMKRGYVYVWEACEFCGCAFLISEKSDEQKIAPEILRFASMLFNVIINVSIF